MAPTKGLLRAAYHFGEGAGKQVSKRALANACNGSARAVTRSVNADSRIASWFSRDALRTCSPSVCSGAVSSSINRVFELVDGRPTSASPTGPSGAIRGFASEGLPVHTVLSMPALSPTMEQGNVANWQKKEGEAISAGDVLADIETDKATLAFESMEDGFLAKILVSAGEKNIPVGKPLAIVVEEEGDVAAFKDYQPEGAGGAPKAEEKSAPPKKEESAAPKNEAAPKKKKKKKAAPKAPAKEYPPHTKIDMPALSPTMEQGNIASWSKKEGDEIMAGDAIAEIETDKATMSLDSQEDGFLAKILVQDGAKNIPVGTLLAILVEDADSVSKFADFSPEASSAEPSTSEEEADETPEPSGTSEEPVSPPKTFDPFTGRIWPTARKILAEFGVDPWEVKGSGLNGIITKDDAVATTKGMSKGQGSPKPSAPKKEEKKDEGKKEGGVKDAGKKEGGKKESVGGKAAAAGGPPKKSVEPLSSGEFEDVPNSQIRRIIAQRLKESKWGTPHFYLSADANLDAVLSLRKELKEKHKVAVSVNDFVVRAVAVALQRVPEANAFWDPKKEEVTPNPSVDICVAVATDKGLMTPIVKRADQKTLSTISSEVKDLAERARSGKLKPEEFQGGSFSISNLGMFPIDYFSAIINPPQACIMAVGKGTKKVVWQTKEDGTEGPAVVTQMTVTLSADQRVYDGEIAGRFLAEFTSAMKDPAQLLL